ncbi:hypothetical protein OAZ27_03080 [Bacteroidia bacterium]|nr:hypothetical protein [Bacteroidia bacterium]
MRTISLKFFLKPLKHGRYASGMRSGNAVRILKSNGIEAYNVGPWQKADRLKSSN